MRNIEYKIDFNTKRMKSVRELEIALEREKGEYEVKLRKKFERVI